MSNLSTRGFNPVVPYTPAFAAEDCPFAPYETFDIDSCPSTLVQVVRQGCYPDNSIRQEVSHEECVREIANQCVIIFILSTSQTRTFLGTGTLFQPDKIITARHVLNDVKAVDLKVGFLFFDTLQRENIIDGNITVLEDGADHELDYAILGLPSNIKRIQPASLSTDNDILGSSLLIHHPEGRPQYFSVHQSLPSAHYQLQYSSFHDTTHISSGAGYRDCKKRLFAIHTSVNASDTYAKRAALFIRTITETNPRTLLLQRANSASPRICVSYNQPLPYFSLSFLDIDESRRQEALGGTPQIRSPI
ncbi:MAG TPA: serine protease, partial [Rhabdochlamydiaceae bacterium]|nr:serine protease [Rhabdochlamydiaceae bacterium]